MSKVSIDTVQLGSSATATQNLVIRTNKDGTFTIARGNAGATTQDILTIDANGGVVTPQRPLICARLTASMVATQLIPWDTIQAQQGITYSSTTRRFTVPVSGFYRINVNVFKENTANPLRVILGKNTDTPGASAATNLGMIYSSSGSYDAVSIDAIASFNAGDYFVVQLAGGGLYSAPADAFGLLTASLL